MDESAVLDAVTGVDTGTQDFSADTYDGDSGLDDGEESGVEGVEPALGEQQQAPQPLIVNGKLNDSAKAYFDKLQVENPALAKQLRNDLFMLSRWKENIPGGPKEFKRLNDELARFGGLEGVGGLQTKLEYFDGLDAAFTAGDPKFIEALTDTPEGEEAFRSLAPAMIDKFRQSDPEAFDAIVARSTMDELRSGRFLLDVERLRDLVGDNPKAAEYLNNIIGWVNGVNAKAGAQPKAQARPGQQGRQQQGNGDAETRLAEATRREWSGEARTSSSALFQQEFAKLSAGRTLTPEQKDAVMELYTTRANRALKEKGDFENIAERYFTANNKSGWLKHVTGATREIMPKALAAAFNAVIGSKPGPRQVGQQQQRTTPKDLPNGVVALPARPKVTDVDPARTTPSMIAQRRAVLRDGRAVQW